jgi:hypothetical protein
MQKKKKLKKKIKKKLQNLFVFLEIYFQPTFTIWSLKVNAQ